MVAGQAWRTQIRRRVSRIEVSRARDPPAVDASAVILLVVAAGRVFDGHAPPLAGKAWTPGDGGGDASGQQRSSEVLKLRPA